MFLIDKTVHLQSISPPLGEVTGRHAGDALNLQATYMYLDLNHVSATNLPNMAKREGESGAETRN